MSVLIACSGGIDSTTLLADALMKRKNVATAFFNYGSKHNSYEGAAHDNVLQYYDGNANLTGLHFVVNLNHLFAHFESNLLESGGEIPNGHYTDKSMSKTVVPCRNMVFISTLAGIAASHDIAEIWIGVHQGDHAIYPDCRPDFIRTMEQAVHFGSDKKVRLVAPYLMWTKTEIVRRGLALDAPYSLTRTCYKDQDVACGECGSCTERLEAFSQNETMDPITYIQDMSPEIEALGDDPLEDEK